MKDQFIDSISKYKDKKAQLKKDSAKYDTDSFVTDEGRDEVKEKAAAKHDKALEQLKTDLLNILDSKREELGKIDNTKALDQDYNLRLNNILKIAELSGRTMNDQDIVEAVEPFIDDTIALKGIEAALIKSGKSTDQVAMVVPIDNRAETLKRIDSLSKSVSSLDLGLFVNSGDLGSDIIDSSEYLGYEAVLNVLDQDLNYVR